MADYYYSTTWWIRLVIALSSVVSTFSSADVQVIGIVGNSVELECDVPKSDVPDVEWVERVWNTDEHPKKIFHSRNNPDFQVQQDHPNKGNYRVGAAGGAFALTISQLDMDHDVGKYTCRSKVHGKTHEKNYYLTVGELPVCSGKTNVTAHESTLLFCEMSYSGGQPQVDWFQDDELVDSRDEYDIRVAKKVVELTASYKDDGTTYRCRMTLGATTHECSLQMTVTYSVHEPRFIPHKEKLRSGDELKCTAKGNPVPTITLTPDDLGPMTSGPGWKAVTIDHKWEGQPVTAQCMASNTVHGKDHMLDNQISFQVTAHKQRQHGGHNNHHTTHPTSPVEEDIQQSQPELELTSNDGSSSHNDEKKVHKDAKSAQSKDSPGAGTSVHLQPIIFALLPSLIFFIWFRNY